MRLEDLQHLNDLLDRINEIIDQFYKMAPSDTEIEEEKTSQNSQDIWDKTLKALKFYQKIRNFVVTIV